MYDEFAKSFLHAIFSFYSVNIGMSFVLMSLEAHISQLCAIFLLVLFVSSFGTFLRCTTVIQSQVKISTGRVSLCIIAVYVVSNDNIHTFLFTIKIFE